MFYKVIVYRIATDYLSGRLETQLGELELI